MSVTHIAGPVITVGCRRIQRCAVCGEKMKDNLPFLQGRTADFFGPQTSKGSCPSELDSMRTWGPGSLVRYKGNSQVTLPHIDGESVPEDCCIELVEE